MKLESLAVSKSFGKVRLIGGKREGGTLAVDNATVSVSPGDFVTIVGESGSGKSTLARILLGIVQPDSGDVLWNGQSTKGMTRETARAFHRNVQCVLQDPSGSLNPRKTVGQSITEVIRLHGLAKSKSDVQDLAMEALDSVGLKQTSAYFGRYPHELSGGQRQRVLIARAISLRPKVIVADEAVSALDVSVKTGVLNLMNDLRRQMGIGYLLITHDLPVVKKVASYVYVMNRGQIVEQGNVSDIFMAPKNDYTKTLVGAAPDLDAALEHRQLSRSARLLNNGALPR